MISSTALCIRQQVLSAAQHEGRLQSCLPLSPTPSSSDVQREKPPRARDGDPLSAPSMGLRLVGKLPGLRFWGDSGAQPGLRGTLVLSGSNCGSWEVIWMENQTNWVCIPAMPPTSSGAPGKALCPHQQNRDDNTSVSALERLNERLEGRVPGPEQVIRRCVLLPPLERSLVKPKSAITFVGRTSQWLREIGDLELFRR